MNGRRPDDHPRARGTNPRAKGTNPRARATNPHPGKSELTGQWRAAFRRLDRITPELRHRLERELERAAGALDPELEREIRRRLGAHLT